MDHISTKLLMRRLSKGDEKAFKHIYEQYWSKLYSLCFYYTQSKEDAEDMLMEIFISLWNNRGKVNIENLEGYLVKSAKNQSFKYIQKQQRLRKQVHLFEQQADDPNKDSESPERLLEIKEFSLQIDSQVQSLPEKTKKIFLLNRENGLTYEEIACSLGVSVKTVEYHVSKAIKVLSKYVLLFILVRILH